MKYKATRLAASERQIRLAGVDAGKTARRNPDRQQTVVEDAAAARWFSACSIRRLNRLATTAKGCAAYLGFEPSD